MPEIILFDTNSKGIADEFDDWLYEQSDEVQRVVAKQINRLTSIMGEQSRKLLMVSIYLWVLDNWERLG